MDFIGGGGRDQRDSKPKLELTYHTAADCYSIVATIIKYVH